MSYHRINLCILASSLLLALAGCASLENDDRQTIRVEMWTPDGQEIVGASCRFSNERSTINFSTPSRLIIPKAQGDAHIRCTFKNMPMAQATLRASSDRLNYASRTFDRLRHLGRASAYEYPTWIQMMVGQHGRFDASSNRTGLASEVIDPNASTADTDMPENTQQAEDKPVDITPTSATPAL